MSRLHQNKKGPVARASMTLRTDLPDACGLAGRSGLAGYRAAAAQAGGMDRQTLRDWVHRYNAAGVEGLVDQPRSGRPARLSWVQQGKVSRWVEEGADLARDGVVRFRRVDLRDRIHQVFGISMHERSIGKLLRRLNFRRISVRPLHPQTDLAAQETFKKTSP